MNPWEVRELIDEKVGNVGCWIPVLVVLGMIVYGILSTALEIIQPGILRLALQTLLQRMMP